VCWGDPPGTAAFSAVAIPPANRPELAPTELTEISISADGTISGLEFSEAVALHGRIVLGCAEGQETECGALAPVPAQVVVERSSIFLGGPQYRRSVLTNTTVGEDADT